MNIFIEKTSIGAASDSNGDYFIVNIPPGEYTVVASMIGYQSMKVTKVFVTADKTTNISFELEVQRLELSEEVVVTAEKMIIRKDLTSSELSVTSREIKNLPVESLADILQLKAGVVTDAGGGIHIRGGRTSEVSYLVDNRELYFVPVINPDGYAYNEQISPNGGGMWRKSRRNNGGGIYGVDLNRNYGYN